MNKTTLSFEITHDATWFYVLQHIQVDAEHYTTALIGAGFSAYDAITSAKMFCDGMVEQLNKLQKDYVT